MSPVICLPDEATLQWFLSKTQVAVVYASGAITPAIFPKQLRLDIEVAAPGCDLGVASPGALNHLSGRPFNHGDCAVFARQTLVRRAESYEYPRLRKPLLKAWTSANGIAATQPGAPIPRPVNLLADGLSTALALVAAEPKPSPSPGSVSGLNPYDVLGVRPDASLIDIRRARRARMMEYHPDRVASLGARLRQVAETEARKINWAGSFLERSRLS